jgi:pimeloyl-ACP methyl ester carboxylesterase
MTRGAGNRPALRRARSRSRLLVDGTTVHVDGRGDHAVLMLHGWPDTHRLWDPQVEALREDRRCVRFTLPGFDVAAGPPSPPPSLDQTVATIGRIADAVSPERPVDLLLHDWGCMFGYAYALGTPERVRRIVGVDVGDAGSPAHVRAVGLAGGAAIVAYQSWLALAWRVGGARGDAMTRWMARVAGAPGDPATIGASMDWPYQLMRSGAYAAYTERMRAFEPPRPMLYVYGRRKPFMFHSPAWIERLAHERRHRVLSLPTGHWPMRDAREAFDRAVSEWLADGMP